MRTMVLKMFDGIPLTMPKKVAAVFPTKYTYKTFPTNYCGAGRGFGEKIVPDYIFGPTRFLSFLGLDYSIKISPACFIHDEDWASAPAEWEEFYASNNRFHKNLESIIEVKGANDWIKARAMYRPVTYMNAVNLAGRIVFWSMKAAQGFEIPNNATKYLDHAVQMIHKERI